MAKAKVLADRISITSEVLTDVVLERVSILSPETLVLRDANNLEKTLFEVVSSDCNSFTKYGAGFKNGVSLGNIDESVMMLDKEVKEAKIKNILTLVLTRINAIEEQVNEFLDANEEIDIDLEFLD